MIIPDYLYLNKEKLRDGEYSVTIGEVISTDKRQVGALITHKYIDSDMVNEQIEEAYKRGSEHGYQEGYLDGTLETERERDTG